MDKSPPRTWSDLLHWTYIGVDHNIAGNGGPQCALFTGPIQRLVETIIFASVGCLEAYLTYRYLTLPKTPPSPVRNWPAGRVLSVVLCLVFGMEIGFKLSTGQLIYLLNPCHLVTMIQIYLLTAPASYYTQAVFRFHMHILNGPLLAIIFPVTNTRMLPFEIEMYFIQHILIYIIPYFLMRHADLYAVEPMGDFYWAIFTVGVVSVYHFIPLHALSLLTEVNLNNMLCPAISDPFYGRWYRIWAFFHQALLMPIHAKVYMKLCSYLLPADNKNRLKCLGDKSDEVPLFRMEVKQCNGLHNGNGDLRSK